ncbi:MAG: 6,7-dimethyl-8-ribityllumazine synthase [bacterium]
MQKSQTHNFEVFDASKYKIGIVCAHFNQDITGQILDSALDKLNKFQVANENIDIYHVAGSVEIPIILQSMAKTGQYQCLIAIGAIIRGETDHYNYVAKLVVEGINRVTLDHSLPIGFAVLTTGNKELAQARVSIGAEAVQASLHNAQMLDKKAKMC